MLSKLILILQFTSASFEIANFAGEWYGQAFALLFSRLEGPEFVTSIFEKQNEKFKNLKCPQVVISQNAVASIKDDKGNLIDRKKITMDVNFQQGGESKDTGFLKRKKKEPIEKVRFQGVCLHIESGSCLLNYVAFKPPKLPPGAFTNEVSFLESDYEEYALVLQNIKVDYMGIDYID